MKQTTEEAIRKIEIELNELTGKICSMERFFITQDYQSISGTQKELLKKQHHYMELYKETLIERVILLRKEMGETNGTQSN